MDNAADAPLGFNYPQSSSWDDTFCEMPAVVFHFFVVIAYKQGSNMIMAWVNERVCFSLFQT